MPPVPGRADRARADRRRHLLRLRARPARSATTTRSSAVFRTANNVKERQPVRIAGVDVGKVVEVEHPEPGTAARRGHDADRGRGPADPQRRAREDPPAAVPRGQLVPRPRARHRRQPGELAGRRDRSRSQQTRDAGAARPGAHRAPVGHAQEPPDAASPSTRARSRARAPTATGARSRTGSPPTATRRSCRTPRSASLQHDLSELHRRRGPRGARARPQPGSAEGADHRLQHGRRAPSRARPRASSGRSTSCRARCAAAQPGARAS